MATCNNRNPAPPCAEGFEEKQNPKGDICCFKIPKHKIEAQKARIEKRRKKELEADIMAARLAIGNAIKAETKRKMQKEKEEKARVQKEKKDKKDKKEKKEKQDKLDKKNKQDNLTKTQIKKLHGSPQKSSPKQLYVIDTLTSEKCNNRNPAPPCKDGFRLKVRTLKNGSRYKCCFKDNKGALYPPRNPAPPCADGFVERKKTRKNGHVTSCCYKSRV
tara:strand:- start:768 stop:1421 length:654 start_codon:yes stop_codon:yes gene_type:complete